MQKSFLQYAYSSVCQYREREKKEKQGKEKEKETDEGKRRKKVCPLSGQLNYRQFSFLRFEAFVRRFFLFFV